MAEDYDIADAQARGPRNLGFVSRGVVSIVLLLTVLGCGEEPNEPPQLTGFSPVIASVDANSAIKFRVIYEDNGYGLDSFQWTAEAGEIEGNGEPEITYRAPETPGDYELTVTVAYADDKPGLSLESEVKVLSVDEAEWTPASPLPAEEQSEATSETAETGEATGPDDRAPLAAQSIADAADTASPIDRIRARGRLDVIVQIEFPPFSFYGDDGSRVGFDVDLARELARRWLEDPAPVRFVPVPTDARITSLLAGRGDIIVAALTNTEERRDHIDFSATYFMDGQRLLVQETSDVADVCGLRGQKVAVIQGSTSRDNVVREASACGFDIVPDLVEFRRHPAAVEALLDGEVAAFTGDGIALERFADEEPLKVVGNHFSEEPYGIGVPKGDETLRKLVDATLSATQADGTFAAIYAKWFGDALRPYPMQIDADAAQVAALVGEAQTGQVTEPPAGQKTEPPAGQGEAETTYVVQPGDTLSKIAGKMWGDVSPGSWRRLYEANKDVIGDNPSLITVGMTLTIPES
jgi:ABC-type amino acid transport substrate-binding protein